MTMPPAPTADTIRSLRKAGWSRAELKGFLSPWGLDPDVYAPAAAVAAPAVVPPPPAAAPAAAPGQPAAPPAPVAATVDTRVPVAKDTTLPAPPGEQAAAMQQAGYSPEAIKAFQAGQGRAATSSVTAAQVQGTGAGKAGLGSIPPPPEAGPVQRPFEPIEGQETGGPMPQALGPDVATQAYIDQVMGKQPYTQAELGALAGAETSAPGQPPVPPSGPGAPPPPSGLVATPQPSSLGPLNIGPGGIGQLGAAPQVSPPPGAAPGQPPTGAGAAVEPKPTSYSAPTAAAPWDAKTALKYLVDNGVLALADATDPAKVKAAIWAGQDKLHEEFGPYVSIKTPGGKMTYTAYAGALSKASPSDLKIMFGDITGGKPAPSFLEGLFGKANYDYMKGQGLTDEQIMANASPEMIAGKVSEMAPTQIKAWLEGYQRANPDITLEQLKKVPGLETSIRAITAAGYGDPVMPKVTPGEVPTIEDWRTGLSTFKSAMTMIPKDLTSARYWVGLVDSVTPPPGVRFDPVTKSYVMLDGSIIKDPVMAHETEKFKSAMDSYDRMKVVIEKQLDNFMAADKTQAESVQLRKDLDDTDSPDTAAEIAYKLSQADLSVKEMGRKKLMFDATLSLMSNPSALLRASRAGILAGFEDFLGVSIKVPEKMKEGELGMAIQSQLQAIVNAPPEQAMEMLEDLSMQTGWTAEELLLYIRNFASAPGSVGGPAGSQGAVQARTVRRQ